jgi:hypothetical protein
VEYTTLLALSCDDMNGNVAARLKAAGGLCDELLAPSGIAIHPVVARDDGLVSRFVD